MLVGLVIWPVKIVPKMTYHVLSGTLSLYTTINFLQKGSCNKPIPPWLSTINMGTRTRSLATAEIAHDADDVGFSADNVHGALTLAFNSFNSIIIL